MCSNFLLGRRRKQEGEREGGRGGVRVGERETLRHRERETHRDREREGERGINVLVLFT